MFRGILDIYVEFWNKNVRFRYYNCGILDTGHNQIYCLSQI